MESPSAKYIVIPLRILIKLNKDKHMLLRIMENSKKCAKHKQKYDKINFIQAGNTFGKRVKLGYAKMLNYVKYSKN